MENKAESSQIPPQINQNQNKKKMIPFLLILGVVLFSVFGGSIGYFLGSNKKKPSSLPPATIPATLKPTPTPTPPLPMNMSLIPYSDYQTLEPVKVQIDTNSNLFYDFPYPTEIKSLQETQLVPMHCTKNVLTGNTYGGEGKYFYANVPKGQTKAQEIKNTGPYASLRYFIYQKSGINPYSFLMCRTEKAEFFEFTDMENAYIAKVDFDKGRFDTIFKNEAIFMTCGYPIALTTSDIFYFACKGGENAAHTTLYKINVKVPENKPFYTCDEDLPGANPKPPKCSYK